MDKENQNKRKQRLPASVSYGMPIINPATTWRELKRRLDKVSGLVLTKVAAPIGNVLTSTIAASAVPPSLAASPKHWKTAYLTNKLALEVASPYLSPTHYVVGLGNPIKGLERLQQWGPTAQLGGFVADFLAFKNGPKVVKAAPKVAANTASKATDAVINTAAKAGNQTAKKAAVARAINKGVKEATKNGRIEVTDNYFHSPYNWYRIANKPEKQTIEWEGRNITTRDSELLLGTPDGWRVEMLDFGTTENPFSLEGGTHFEPGVGSNEGYFVVKSGTHFPLKSGSAHGNTSLASKGQIWEGSTAGNKRLFPSGIIEGLAPVEIPYGRTRSQFVKTPWEDVPMGGRIGFHTGEMPIDNLGWFLRLSNGKYTYEPIVPEHRIVLNPERTISLLGFLPNLFKSGTYPIYRGPQFNVSKIVNPDGTINPRLAMTALRAVADWFGKGAYRMENRAENSRWHRADPTTYDHTKQAARSAWKLPVPEGFTKYDLMVAALGHDFGKMISGNGHALIGADLARQVFPDLTNAQYTAIAEHMGNTFSTPLSEVTKAADVLNGRPTNYLYKYYPELHYKYGGAKISEAERLGIPKGDRGNLSLNQKQAIEDLAQFRNSGLNRLVFRVTPDWEDFGWNLNRNNPTFMQLFAADGETMDRYWARVPIKTPTGKGVISYMPDRNMAVYSSRSFPTPEGMKWAPGEANMMLDGSNGLKFVLTAPRTDFFNSIVEDNLASLGENLPNTIDKSIVKDFWINARKALRPGTYLSGDNAKLPLGSTLIEAFKKKQLHKTPVLERPLDLLLVRRTGLSPDSYSSIIRLGNRDGSLRWGEGFTKWNNSAVDNKYIYNAYQKLMKGEITPEQYEGIFNKWSLEIGGRPLLWTTIGGQKVPVHPHPYIYGKKQGGRMDILKFL